MGFFSNIADTVKTGVSDALAVGRQVVGMTLDAGSAALGGAKTLITDPKKFVEDTAQNVSGALRHTVNSVRDGAGMIGEGWNEAWATGNPGMFLWKAAGGTIQMASLGVSDAVKEHVESVAEVKRDELGNMTGFEISEDCDAITRIMLRNSEKTVSTVVNADEEVKEAIAEGDTERANKMFGDMVSSTVAKPLSRAAAVGSAVVAITATGGAAAPFIVGGLAVGGTLGGMYVGKKQSDFDIANAADDVTDRVESEVGQLVAAGQLDEAGAARYREVMTPYYQNAAYTNYGEGLGEAYMGEGATNSDFKQVLLESAGLPEADAASVQVPPGAAEAVRTPGDEALLAAFSALSEEDKARFAQAFSGRVRYAQQPEGNAPAAYGGLSAVVAEADAPAAPALPAAQRGPCEENGREYVDADYVEIG